MSEWQPIETAPKNGTLILAYETNTDDEYLSGCMLAWWNPRQCFWEIDGGGFGGELTHWQPLPEPPK